MNAETEPQKDAWAVVTRSIIRAGAIVIIRRRWSRIITGRWIIISDRRRRSGRGNPIAIGAILDLRELIGAPCH
jgi:hypothetical protein